MEPEQFVCQRNAMMTCVPFEVCFYSWEAERHTLSLQLLWLVLQPTCGRSLTSQSSPWPPALSLRPLSPWPVLAALFPLPSSLSSAGCTFFWRFMSESLSFPMCRTSGVIPEPPHPLGWQEMDCSHIWKASAWRCSFSTVFALSSQSDFT